MVLGWTALVPTGSSDGRTFASKHRRVGALAEFIGLERLRLSWSKGIAHSPCVGYLAHKEPLMSTLPQLFIRYA